MLNISKEVAGPNKSWIKPYTVGSSDTARPAWDFADEQAEAPTLKSGGRILVTGGGGNIGESHFTFLVAAPHG